MKESFDPSSIRTFQSEFTALKNLRHNHLPRYYAVFEAEGNGYLVMELIPGQSLADVLEHQLGQPLAEAQVLGYAIQLCDVLTYLHQQTPPILHRDIKPANIRLTPDGLVKLVDFGLLKQGSEATHSSRRGGTPAYAPLEQWDGIAQHTGPRSDLYSLAASLYHLLTGQAPMSAATRITTHRDPLQPPHQHNPQISAHVSAVLMQALSIKADQRQASVAAFKQALLSGPETSPAPAIKPIRPLTRLKTARSAQRPDWLPEMIDIPAGPFLMGSSNHDAMAEAHEHPQHRLTLPPYTIGKTPVTNSQFRPFVEGDGYTNPAYWTGYGWQWRQQQNRDRPFWWHDQQWNGADYPVVGITWYEAVAYCRWISAQTGREYRLPSETEWEKAARGDDGRIWPWGNRWDPNCCNSEEAGKERTTPVGSYPNGASPYGVLDMAGNVWEWCATHRGKQYPYQIGDEWNTDYLERRGWNDSTVLRGGCWGNAQQYVRGTKRNSGDPCNHYYHYVGLRLASYAPL
ncbi:MAG: SUMF1/EgtB/PvdO family nonheme iron enzyme [Chloroflexaceae bacterium]|nr:SUMF1/EgtB/PvdO family nonheme iron enzyme [Chloroflexaceae bacterium]